MDAKALLSNHTVSTKAPPEGNGGDEQRRNLSPEKLQDLAKTIRRHIITMIGEAGSGHPGGSLSACMAMCPSDPKAFKACVQECEKRCGGDMVV